MEELIQKIKDAIAFAAQTNGAIGRIDSVNVLPAAEYDEELINTAKESIEEVLGKALPPVYSPGGEDFHYYKKKLDVKTAYIGLGADLMPGLHHPDVVFNKKALIHGQKILSNIILKRLV